MGGSSVLGMRGFYLGSNTVCRIIEAVYDSYQ